ncbi:MAG: site-specific integrase [bacterium]|nr:site-specific integrase [bacterium]
MRSTGTSDKTLAHEVMKKIKEDAVRRSRGLEPIETVESILLSEFIAVYLTERKKDGKMPRTIETDSYALGRLLNRIGDCSLISITKESARKYKGYKLENVKPVSASIELRSIRAAFNWALEKPGTKYLYSNPFKQKGLIPTVPGRTIPPIFSPEEKARFLESIEDENHKRLFKFFLLTGCRRAEAVNLKWADIDFEQKQLTFRRTKTKRDRAIPINLELMQILIALDRTQAKPFSFGSDWISHLFERYLRRAKIDRPMSLHGLRHTCASDMVRAGVHLTKIQKFLGHTSVKTTEIYTHVLPEDLREAAEVLSCVG